MAKPDRADKKPKPKRKDPLVEAISVFGRGDYALASAKLAALRSEADLSEGAQEQAALLLEATRVERAALYVGLASAVLLLLVVLSTVLTQPG